MPPMMIIESRFFRWQVYNLSFIVLNLVNYNFT